MDGVHDRTPVIVGVGQVTVRPGEEARQPVALMAEALRQAAADSGAPGVLDAAQSIRVVALLSSRYPDPAALVAEHLGIGPVQTVLTTDGGNSVGALIARTARSILTGELDVALVTGGEAWRTRQAARRDGTDLGWTTQPEGTEPDLVLGAPLDMNHPVERDIGVWHPIEVYPLFDNALRAHAGRTIDEHAAHLGALWERFGAVAAGNPHAWDRSAPSAAEIVTPTPGNRMVSSPYTKLLCSNEMVDQSAGVILCSAARARALGVPSDRWVFPLAAVEAKAPYVSERMDLWSSPMIGLAGARLRALTGVGPDDVAHVDLYSCFPSAVQVQASELGFGHDRELTVTGGMRFFGGPWNNYTMHAVVSMVDRLRDDPRALGLCTSNGGLLTKQVTSLFSATPPATDFQLDDVQDAVDALPRRGVDPSPAATTEVETYTVVHDREGPTRGIVAALLPDGRRGWGMVTDAGALAAMVDGDPLGAPVELRDGVAHLV